MTPPYLADKPAVINASVGRQLFVDDFLVANETDGIRTVFWSPTYDAVNPVISASEPWELNSIPYYGGFASSFSGGAFWNPAKQRYELFYKCGDAFCVAYSADSVKWTKPSFDNSFKSCSHKTASGKTSTACNMVLEHDWDGAVVWLDLDTTNSSQRYILAAGGSVFTFYSSADGTSFKLEGVSGPIEDRSSVYKDALRDKWVYSIKASGEPPRYRWHLGCIRLKMPAISVLTGPSTSPGRTRRFWDGDDLLADRHWGSISGKAPVAAGSPVQWMGSDKKDDPNLACGGNTQLYNFDGVVRASPVAVP